MSKMDDLRKMREARYEQAAARAAAPKTARTPASTPVAKPAASRRPTPDPAPAAAEPPSSGEPTESLCGHRNMSGRTCTREQGHAAKSHRYS